jgi:tRNA dimethylallyltransferase
LNFEPETLNRLAKRAAPIVVITGPTGVGKSAVAFDLAEALGGEIVNADSQQVYCYLNIGTDKPSEQERSRVPHHVIDVVEPNENFNVAAYCDLAEKAIAHIQQRGRVAIVCGGTGLYIKALTTGLFVGPSQEESLRESFESDIKIHGIDFLYHRLERSDPAAASWIHPHDRQRIIRALEVYELTGKPMSEWHREHGFNDRRYETLAIALDRRRAELYELINRRCERMIGDGLLQEVANLVERGYGLHLKPLRSVGYRHMGLVYNHEKSLEDALDLMKRDTRHLAKRQLTWFRRQNEIRWFHPDDRSRIFEIAEKFFAQANVSSARMIAFKQT